MPTNYAKHISKRQTSQNEKIPGAAQVKNSAGGYTRKVDMWTHLRRFLILGSEGGTFYISEKKLTQNNCKTVLTCIKEDAARVVNETIAVSKEGLAPKNDPAIFVLSLVLTHADVEGRRHAAKSIDEVCRIGTHLFTLTSYLDKLRSWGRLLREGFANWYNSKDVKSLTYQLTKYANRGGWSHLDILRSAHIRPASDEHNLLFRYTKTGYTPEMAGKIPYLDAVEHAKRASSVKELISLVEEHDLPREVIPTEYLNDIKVWEALLQKMPLGAMIRNLGKMTSLGLLGEGKFDKNNFVTEKLTDIELLKKARIHPLAVLVAFHTYAQGHGFKGSLSWSPARKIVDALDAAFYASFGSVEATGKNHILAIDISGSMSWDSSRIAGTPIFARDAAAAMALVTASVEKNYEILVFSSGSGFNKGVKAVNISPRMRLDAVKQELSRHPMGGTDCALPMLWANKNKVPADAFFIYTDNETWAGNIHPSQALQKFRREQGKPEAKLVTVGMVSNGFSIADPNDPGMLDVVGFDTSTPNIMSEFVKGTI